ncbi:MULTISPECIES: DUF86 domain-containing protein [Brevibacillus]|uniref:DUF86 domain-containing protein n=1 Tax=Brevibacillus TaxID=55080 RepID=UPI000E2F3CD3|nr:MULTISPECIES: HepT-like ribonuclease domain-containing protein [Brevibacillus]MED1790687.1 DUF86 domain-containing protein [Brevibacillus laterosporus]RFB31625.1 DUF86 domain-containing protein [Brevibacillus sp. VP]
MYDVNTAKVEQVLTYMERMLTLLSQNMTYSDEELACDQIKQLATERALHICIEGIADVGNALIDGFIMRDPGSYTDIVEILRDETVLTNEQATVLHRVMEFRKPLVTYSEIPVLEMSSLVREALPILTTFAPSVRSYIQKELF